MLKIYTKPLCNLEVNFMNNLPDGEHMKFGGLDRTSRPDEQSAESERRKMLEKFKDVLLCALECNAAYNISVTGESIEVTGPVSCEENPNGKLSFRYHPLEARKGPGVELFSVTLGENGDEVLVAQDDSSLSSMAFNLFPREALLRLTDFSINYRIGASRRFDFRSGGIQAEYLNAIDQRIKLEVNKTKKVVEFVKLVMSGDLQIAKSCGAASIKWEIYRTALKKYCEWDANRTEKLSKDKEKARMDAAGNRIWFQIIQEWAEQEESQFARENISYDVSALADLARGSSADFEKSIRAAIELCRDESDKLPSMAKTQFVDIQTDHNGDYAISIKHNFHGKSVDKPQEFKEADEIMKDISGRLNQLLRQRQQLRQRAGLGEDLQNKNLLSFLGSILPVLPDDTKKRCGDALYSINHAEDSRTMRAKVVNGVLDKYLTI